MNILMTSCGCSRLAASCEVGIRGVALGLYGERRGGGRRIEGRSREEQTAAEGKSSVSPFLRNYNRATYRGTAPSVFHGFSFSPSFVRLYPCPSLSPACRFTER